MSLNDRNVENQFFRYKKSKNIFAISITVIWIILFASEIIFIADKGWLNYGIMGVGLFLIFIYSFGLVFQYAQLKNGVFSIYSDLIPKRIVLNEVESVRKSAGDYVVKTKSKSIQINPQPLDEDSKKRLKEMLELKK